MVDKEKLKELAAIQAYLIDLELNIDDKEDKAVLDKAVKIIDELLPKWVKEYLDDVPDNFK